jgi:hypothetical protein
MFHVYLRHVVLKCLCQARKCAIMRSWVLDVLSLSRVTILILYLTDKQTNDFNVLMKRVEGWWPKIQCIITYIKPWITTEYRPCQFYYRKLFLQHAPDTQCHHGLRRGYYYYLFLDIVLNIRYHVLFATCMILSVSFRLKQTVNTVNIWA